jgi:hypothetical protein
MKFDVFDYQIVLIRRDVAHHLSARTHKNYARAFRPESHDVSVKSKVGWA